MGGEEAQAIMVVMLALSSGDINTGQAELVGKSSNTSNSHGIFAQSLGGGGGGGGFNVSAGIGGAVGLGASINVGIGGDGGVGGDGKSVDLGTRTEANTATEIPTYGNKSTGIVAQSVGGGGGSGGFVVSAVFSGGGVGGVAMSITWEVRELAVAGGSVTTNLKSNVSTSGEKSTGSWFKVLAVVAMVVLASRHLERVLVLVVAASF